MQEKKSTKNEKKNVSEREREITFCTWENYVQNGKKRFVNL